MAIYARINADFREYGGKSGRRPLFVFYQSLMTEGNHMNVDSVAEELKKLTERLGFEFVGVELVREGGEQILRLYADGEGGMTLDGCEQIAGEASAFLDGKADEIEGTYLLEVSSPGLERPLFKIEDYRRFSGRLANVRLKSAFAGKKRFQATIADAEDGTVSFDCGGERFVLPFEQIMSAKLVYTEQKGQKKTFKKSGGKQ